jgi:hypothetical protein
MKNMEEWFAAQDFDRETLPNGHRNRFLEKLEQSDSKKNSSTNDPKIQNDTATSKKGRVISMTHWFKWSLVAGLALIIGLGSLQVVQNSAQPDGLESVSPEMAQAQDFFTSTINVELERLEKAKTPENERIITDTKTGLLKLETEYTQIKKDFKVNKNSKAVIAAMIQNFQSRITLLETALNQIDQLQQFKDNKNENLL